MPGFTSLFVRSSSIVLAATLSVSGTNHQVRMDEVMAGLSGDTNVQYIVLSANGDGQKDWGPQGSEVESRAMLVFFDGAGNQTGIFKFPNDPPNGANTVLIATAAFTNRTGLHADIVIPPMLSPGSGKVCFKGNPANPAHFHVNLCLSYGNFPANQTEGGGAPAPILPVSGEPTALVRFQNFFFIENNLNADFRLGTPHPTNTARLTTSLVGPGPTISANPPAVEFFPMPFPGGSLAQQIVTLRNIGTLNPLTITSITLQTNSQSDFFVLVDSGESTLAPGGTRNLTLGFLARAPGLRQASLRVQSNDPEQPSLTIPISGRAVNVDPCATPDIFGAFAQNSCVDAMFVGPGVIYTGNNVNATADGSSPCNQPPLFMGPDVWFKYIAGTNGGLTVNLAGSDSNTIFSIHRACTGNTNSIFCAGPFSVQPFNTFVTNGQMLLIRVSSRTNTIANFRMTLTGPPLFDFDRNKNGRNDSCEFDFGDAPISFPTLTSSNGARHRINNILFLGSRRDADPDGQPTAQADGDNLDGERNDDDGIEILSPLHPGGTCALNISATASGFLSGWCDFNADGDWDDAGERIFNNMILNAGENNRGFLVPTNAILGNTFARFRLSSIGGLGPEGLAEDGEVEDYLLEITSPSPPAISVKVRFNEILGGLNGDSSVQFIELEVLDDSHKSWGPGSSNAAMLVFYDALGRQTGRFVFPSNAPAGASTVLVATPRFVELTGLQPDFVMPPELNATSGKVAFRTQTEGIALSYGGNGYYGTTDGAGPPGSHELSILGAVSLRHFPGNPPFGLNRNVAVSPVAPTPQSTAGQTATLTEDDIIEQGRRVFSLETFNGNGRTCQTCHQPGRDQFGLTAETVRSMPADDPLFVFEPKINILRLSAASFPSDLRGPITGSGGTARVRAGSADTYYVIGGANLNGTISDTHGNSGVFSSFQPGDLQGPNPRNGSPHGLEDSARLRGPRALVLENIDGFTQREVFRTSPHLLHVQMTAPYGLSGEFSNLRDFSDGAVVQHFSRSMERVPDRDFRHPTTAELVAMEAFMNSIVQSTNFDLTFDRFATTEAQKRGRNSFFSNDSKCSKCHSGPVLAFADGSLTGTVLGRNESFDTGVANQLTNLVGESTLPTEPAGLAPGQSTRKFSTPPLFGIRLTPPFFHDGSAATLTDAVKFYDRSEFVASAAGALVGAVPAANQPAKIADIVAFLESLVEIPIDFTRRLDFGVVCSTGQPPSVLFASITNTSTATVAIVSMQLAGTNATDFQIVSDTGQSNLNPGQVRTVGISFAPATSDIRSATLEFTAQVVEIPGNVSFGVALEGIFTEARAEVFPRQLTFAPRSIDAGGSASQFFTITNFGPGELLIRNISFGPTDPAFATFGVLTPLRIAANASLEIGVEFDPSTRGLKTAGITLDLAACNLQKVDLLMTGLATSRVDHFTFGPISSPRPVNDPFLLQISARDVNGDIVDDYTGPVYLSAHSANSNFPPALLITEIDPGNPDRVELQNLSASPVDLAGWRLLLYDSFPVPRSTINLPGVLVASNGVFIVTEGGVFPGIFPNLFTGTNLSWIAGSDQIAALLLDNNQNIVDFVTTGARTNITAPFTVPVESWNGPGINLVAEDGVSSYQRRGTFDHNDASDWIVGSLNVGSGNPQLISFGPFPFGSVPISLESVPLVNGIGSGDLTVFAEAGNLRLVARDASGILGTSTLLNIQGTLPTIDNLPDSLSTDEDVLPPPIVFQIGDAETPLDQLIVKAASLNPNFLSAGSLVLQGTGSVRTLQILPPTNFFGIGTIIVSVTDGAGTNTASFELNIRPVNDPPRIAFSPLRENFDSSFSIPPNWTSSGLWQIVTNNHDSPPNAAFVPNPSGVSDSRLDSPEFFVASSSALLSFRHSFNSELCCDGGVLEISIGGTAFTNISQLGGIFLQGAPNTPQGWRGLGPQNLTTLVRLPPTSAGRLNRLRWRFTSNASIGGQGWFIDSIMLSHPDPFTPIIDEDTSLIAAFTIEDPDPDAAPTITVNSTNQLLLPNQNLELLGSGLSRTLIARPVTNLSGFTDITITINENGDELIATLPLQVRSVNDPPIIDPIPNPTIFAGNLLQQQIAARDPDGSNILSFQMIQTATGAVVNPTSGLFTWRPSASQTGSNFFRVRVSENSVPAISATQTFHVIVLPLPLLSSSVAFGTQCVAEASTVHRTLIITNNSTNTIQISSISITGSNAVDFAIETNLAQFDPGERRTMDVQFAPQSVGRKQAALEIVGTIPSAPGTFLFQAGLTGSFLDMAVDVFPPALVFGPQDLVTGPLHSVIITNIGQSPLRITETQVTGTNVQDFQLLNVNLLTLTNGQTHTVQIRFTPRSRGIKTGTLRIGTDACVSNRWEIPITGTATSTVQRFTFGALGTQSYNTPFPLQVTARDSNNEPVPEFSGPLWVYTANRSPILITEVDPGLIDRVEFMNVSTNPIDVSGWEIVLYDPPPIVKSVTTIPSSSIVASNGIFTIQEQGTGPGTLPNLFSGATLDWTGAGSRIAVMLRNAAGEIMDFFCTTSVTDILDPVPIPPYEWSGIGVTVADIGALSYQRIGSLDRNVAADWLTTTPSIGFRINPLEVPFKILQERALTNQFTFNSGVATVAFRIPVEQRFIDLLACDDNGHLGSNLVTVTGAPPILAGLPATLEIPEDAPMVSIPFELSDAETPLQELTLSVNNSNTNLIPATSLVVLGTNPSRELRFAPATNRFGSATITVIATDRVQTIISNIAITVRPVNDPPIIALLTQGSIFESFDNVAPPTLPPAWSASSTLANVAWQTTNNQSDSFPNSVFVPNVSSNSDLSLISPTFVASGNGSIVSFRHQFNTESCCDHARLEISIDTNLFVNITTLGATFSSGPYNSFSSWSGSSGGGFITSTIQLPASAAGKNIRLRWRFTTDSSVPGIGWWVDTILVTNILSPGPAAITLNEDSPVIAQFRISDIESGSDDLLLSATTSDPSLLPINNVVFSGTGSNRVALLTPVLNAFGTAIVHLVVSDGFASASTSMQFNYLSVNDLPILLPIGDLTVHAQTPLAIPVLGSDPDLTPVNYTTTFPGATIVGGIFRWTPISSQLGPHRITVRANDVQPPGFAERSFTVTVVPQLSLGALSLTETGDPILTWNGFPGGRYRVQHTTDLSSTNWTDLDEVIGIDVLIPALPPAPQRFFRILFLP